MAKILGFELKAVKSFKDHDGYPIYQGNVYYKDKKLGFWSQDAWGGPDHFDFDVAPYNEAMKQMDLVETLNLATPYGFTLEPDMDILMGELLRLRENEKHYKRFAKMGCAKMLMLEHGNECMFIGLGKGEEKLADVRGAQAARESGWKVDDVKGTVLDADSFTVASPLEVAA